jgi:glycerol uptake facilitator-like aquaporin
MGVQFFLAGKTTFPKDSGDVESMQSKEIVEKAVNPVHELEDDDDPFLGIFVSRPTSYNPFFSFFAEAVSTFIFLFLVLQLTARWVSVCTAQ